ISKPFSASLLVSLLATGLFYSEAPDDVLNYYYALLVVPILTIVPGLIYSINKKYFYFVGGVFVLTLLANYFSALVVLDRLLLLLLDVVTVVLLITLLRSRGQIKEKSPNVKWGFTFTIMRLSIFLLSISALANGLGNTGLSKIISQGSLAMIYGGTIIYAAARTLSSLFALIIQLDKVSRLNMIQNYSDEVKARTFQIIRWAAVIYWLYITLSGYLIFEPIYDWFEGLITREWVKESNITIGSFLAFFITLWISFLISRFIRFILQDEILTHFEMPRGVPGAISLLVKLVLIATGFILAFEAAGIKMSNITIIFGALGVGIGFGLQNIFNNLISGLILAFERPIQSGDIIQISTLNLMGEVKEIGIRASTVRTFDGAEVIVPNGNLISNEVINWTLSDHRKRQEIIVGVAYGTDTTKVLEILNKVV
ncbi:MAG: mechanosensitive ion channel, partial [Cyclobacteriaceae bacterium]|nr:mechanosensitive ion channel [Cyclobacteriaceae bacterium]